MFLNSICLKKKRIEIKIKKKVADLKKRINLCACRPNLMTSTLALSLNLLLYKLQSQ